MKIWISYLILALLACPGLAMAQRSPSDDPHWRPHKVMYCSDGEFDWDSGQSLYDFVILTRGEDDFIISYLGIPHPSFERRLFNHLWLEMKGYFSSSLSQQGDVRTYGLKMELEGQPMRKANLVIAANSNYTFTMSPPLSRPMTTTGLCWDSLKPEPRELQEKRRR